MHDFTTYSETRWTQAIDAAIREMTDFAASQQFGIRRAAVMKRRRELGGDRSLDAGPKWTEARTKLLGTALDTELAAKWNIGVYYVRQLRALHDWFLFSESRSRFMLAGVRLCLEIR